MSIWLFAVFAPPVISLANTEEDRVFISFNQNEEEQQEEGKKDNSEEKIVQESTSALALTTFKNKQAYGLDPQPGITPHYLEIPLPPPEQKV